MVTDEAVQRILEEAERKIQIRIKDRNGRVTAFSIHKTDADCLRETGRNMAPYIQELYDELVQQEPELSRGEIGRRIRAIVSEEVEAMLDWSYLL